MNPAQIGGYEILGELGRGAMGIVYRARDMAIGRPVAVKVIRVDAGISLQDGAELRQRLIREASVAGNISHPGIVTIYQLGEDGDAVFIVMEFVEGASLEHLLTNNRSLALPWALDILAQIAVALDYAHKGNVVHRDIKPANILVGSDGRVKIADFGIAKLTSDASAGMTRTGVSIGSPAYMSPEQIQASKIDGRSDQFALGTIAFQMLAGRMPFKGNTAHTLMYQIVMGDPFETLPGDIPLPPQVRAVLACALAKNPDDRYPTCTTFIQELTAAASARPTASRDSTVKIQTPPPTNTAPQSRKEPNGSMTWMLPTIIGVFLTLALIGGAVYWYAQQSCCRTQPKPSSQRTTTEATGHGASPNYSNSLLTAVAAGSVDAVKSLLTSGAQVNDTDGEGNTPLMVASELKASDSIVEALLVAGAQVDSVDVSGRSSLYRAAAAGNLGAMRILLQHGANTNLRARNLSTPLLEAVTHARLEAAEVLIERGADVNLGDSTNTTPLMAAASRSAEIENPADFIKLLLKHGAKRGLKDSQGRIALQRAAASNNSAAVTLLR